MVNRLFFRICKRRADRLIREARAYSRSPAGQWDAAMQAALNVRRDKAVAIAADFATR